MAVDCISMVIPSSGLVTDSRWHSSSVAQHIFKGNIVMVSPLHDKVIWQKSSHFGVPPEIRESLIGDEQTRRGCR